MDALNPIIPDRDPIIPQVLLPAVPKVSPDQKRDDQSNQQQPQRDSEDEEFEHLLEDAVEEDFEHVLDEVAEETPAALLLDVPPGPIVIADAVEVTSETPPPQLDTTSEAWDAGSYDDRRSLTPEPAPDSEDEEAARHIDISA